MEMELKMRSENEPSNVAAIQNFSTNILSQN